MNIEEQYIQKIKNLLIPFEFKDLKRYGGNYDGGYILSESLTNDSNLVYSYGVGPSDAWITFDKHMSDLGKKIFLYDASIKELWDKRESFIFKSEYVNSKNILEHIKQNNHQNEYNMILKMDIEGCEFDTLINCDESLFSHFNQLSIEVHDVLNSNAESARLTNTGSYGSRINNKILLFEKLNKYYNLVHIHGNNNSPSKAHGICDVLELSYIRKDRFEINPKISKKSCPIEGLDCRNTNSAEEIEMNWWIN